MNLIGKEPGTGRDGRINYEGICISANGISGGLGLESSACIILFQMIFLAFAPVDQQLLLF